MRNLLGFFWQCVADMWLDGAVELLIVAVLATIVLVPAYFALSH